MEIREKNKWIEYSVYFVIAASIISFFVIINFKINGFLLQSGDTAVAEQALWNTVHGDWFYQSFLETSNNFREHLNFIQFFYLPFYAAIPNLLILYALINLTYGIAAFILFRFVKEKIGIWEAVIATVLFLFQPIVILQNISAMHVVAVAGPLLLITLILYERKNYWWWLAILIIFGTTSEFIAPTVFLLGVIAWIDRRSLKWILPPAVIGAAMYIAAMIYIKIGFAENDSIIKSFSPSKMIENVKDRFLMLNEFFRPALFVIPFFSKYAILLIPTILLELFIVDSSRLNSGSHLFSLAPVIVVMAVVDILGRANAKWKKIIMASIIAGLLISFPIWGDKVKIEPAKRTKEIEKAINLVKGDGSATASRNISFKFNHRHDFFLIDNKKFTDYVVFDKSFWDYKDDRFEDYVKAVENSNDYEKMMDENKIVVYKKKY